MFTSKLVTRGLYQQVRNKQTLNLACALQTNQYTTFSLTSSQTQTTHSLVTPKKINNNIITCNNYQNKCNYFSTEASDELSSIVSREIDDEVSSGNNELPKEVLKLKTLIEKDWRIVEKPGLGSITLYKKDVTIPNMKIGIQFHCQDTESSAPEGQQQDEEEEEEEEGSGNLRFMVCCNKDGKNIVIGCVTEGGQAEIETVVIRDGDTVDEGFILRGTENLYQGPEYFDLAQDLQDAFNTLLIEDCGVDEGVSSFLVMYTDFKEQTEYVHWLKNVHGIFKE